MLTAARRSVQRCARPCQGLPVSPSQGRETQAQGTLSDSPGLLLGENWSRIRPQGPMACGLPGCGCGGLGPRSVPLGPGPMSCLFLLPSTLAEPCTLPGVEGPFASPQIQRGVQGYGEPQGLLGRGGRGGSGRLSAWGSAPLCPSDRQHQVLQPSGLGSDWTLQAPKPPMPALWTREDRRFPGLRHTAGSRRRVLSDSAPPPPRSPGVTDLGADGCYTQLCVTAENP